MQDTNLLRVHDYDEMHMKDLATNPDFDLEVMRSMMWLKTQNAKEIHELLVLTGKR